MARRIALFAILVVPSLATANPPVASYIFPAGGQRGTKISVRVAGLFLHQQCGFEMLGPGVTAPPCLKRTNTVWFEGPLLPLPESQRQEDYPKDMAGSIAIAADAPLGTRHWRVWTSQGAAAAAMKFMIGDLPEMVEDEIEGDPIPVAVKVPMTINGRIFPRENIDDWSFQASKGQSIRCEVHAARLGSLLDARLEVRDPLGRRITENEDHWGADPVIAFVAPMNGEYKVRIQDTQNHGGQAYVYRLTLTAEPFVEGVYPLGGQRGSTLNVEATGQSVPGRLKLSVPKQASTTYEHVFSFGTKRTNPVFFDVDDLPEFIQEKELGKVIAWPAVLNGRIDKPGTVHDWKWQGRKGETWQFELRAVQLGSRLAGIVTITDREGKTLATAEANPLDPVLTFAVPRDGEYRVRIQDRFGSRGGPDFAYRLRVTPTAGTPDFRLWLASDCITLPRKGTATLKINVERLGGFKETIALDVQGLPKHVTITGTEIKANQSSSDLILKADEHAKIDIARLTILGKAKAGTLQMTRKAMLRVERGQPELSSVLLSVALPTPFVIKGVYDMGFAARGGMHKRKYKIERNGFDGPIVISLADRQARHLQGVEGPTIVVPAGASEFTYSAYLPPWMETGRTCRVCVMGVGTIKEADNTEHPVSFSSVNQNEQLVAVVGPGKLAMDADRTSFTAEPRKAFIVLVRIKRGQAVEGEVVLELIVPRNVRGLSAAKATIASKAERGELIVNCAERLEGAFNMPIIVRGTLMRDGEPLVAEVKLDVQP